VSSNSSSRPVRPRAQAKAAEAGDMADRINGPSRP
jgi:hypothetical protein